MATEEQLYDALRESLEANGQLRKIQAKMRAEIFKMIDGNGNTSRPEMSPQVMVLNELIREYLNWVGYHYTASTLCAEAGLPDDPMKQSVIMKEIGVVDSKGTANLPLLLSLVSTFKEIQKQN